MIIINAKFQVKENSIEQYEELINNLLPASQNEQGNVQYEHFKSTTTPNTYLMYEIWENQEAVESHNNSSHFQEFFKAVKPLLDGPSDIKVSMGE
nr:putative quinol monooxygenase [Mammaliicoccus sp. Marseille-Q6498]